MSGKKMRTVEQRSGRGIPSEVVQQLELIRTRLVCVDFSLRIRGGPRRGNFLFGRFGDADVV